MSERAERPRHNLARVQEMKVEQAGQMRVDTNDLPVFIEFRYRPKCSRAHSIGWIDSVSAGWKPCC
jgi:hypothetical protein